MVKLFISRISLALAIVSVVSGCSTYSANRYSVNIDNVVELKKLQPAGISIGEFTSSGENRSQIMCRGVGPIKTPDDESFAEFIRNAFLDEFRLSEIYDAEGVVEITGNLDSIDFSSGDGLWEMELTVSSTNGRVISVSENYAYKSSFYGETACNQTAQAFMPAVQNLVGKVISSSEFSGLIE